MLRDRGPVSAGGFTSPRTERRPEIGNVGAQHFRGKSDKTGEKWYRSLFLQALPENWNPRAGVPLDEIALGPSIRRRIVGGFEGPAFFEREIMQELQFHRHMVGKFAIAL